MGKADYKAIGKRMQEVRIDRKMTQQEMADALLNHLSRKDLLRRKGKWKAEVVKQKRMP